MVKESRNAVYVSPTSSVDDQESEYEKPNANFSGVQVEKGKPSFSNNKGQLANQSFCYFHAKSNETNPIPMKRNTKLSNVEASVLYSC